MSASTPSAPAASEAPPHRPVLGGSIYLAFVPWVLFSVIAQHDSLAAASIVALIASIVIAAPGVAAGSPKLLELGAIVAFVAFSVVALAVDPANDEWLVRYARAIAALLLAAIAFGSLLLTPFTEQYARQSVPRALWSTPRFKQVNRELTVLWGSVFLVMAVSHVIAGAVDTHRANTIFNWVLPVVMIVFAVKRTGERSHRDPDAGAGPPPSAA